MNDSDELPPVELPITGELDLHSFRPNELGELVPHYLRLCRERGLLEVRVVHGKGTGQIRASVHAILGRMPEVASFSLATAPFGGHGATIVRLRSPGSPTAVPRAGADPSSVS
jgi:DNA-nicking Smr family endonuclease